jgi:hypothetical protein
MFPLLLGPWNRTPIYLHRDAVLVTMLMSGIDLIGAGLDLMGACSTGACLIVARPIMGCAAMFDTSFSEIEGASAGLRALLDGVSVTGARSS